MPSTFFGLTIGQSGLSSYQASINTTANNIANVQTSGYTRQEAILAAAESLRTNTKYGTAGSGVTTTAIEQTRDLYYDLKYWNNNAKLGEYSTKQDYLAQVENYFKDTDSVDGFSTIFSNMYTALESLNTKASEYSARQSYVSASQSLATYFNGTASSLSSLQGEINEVISTDVDKINSIGVKIAALNKQINIIEQQGTTANDLRDKRALLVDELSSLVPVEVTETTISEQTGATAYQLKVNGSTLVDTYDYNQLVCVARENKVNQSDADGLYDIYWADSNGESTGIKFEANTTSATGELKALFQLRDGNNGENFSGTVGTFSTKTDSSGNAYSSVTITNPSITDMASITMADTGTIVLNNKEYTYTGFSMSYDADTGSYSYEFNLDTTVSAADQANCQGKSAVIGSSINYMGIPYYMSQLNGFLRSFTSSYNDIQVNGDGTNTAKDYYGNQGQIYYTASDAQGNQYTFADQGSTTNATGVVQLMSTSSDTYYNMTASNFKVSDAMIKDANLVCTTTGSSSDGTEASDLVDKFYSLCTTDTVFRNCSASSFLQCIISDISVDTQAAETFYTNYQNVVDSIITQRTSVSGVDEDEEALDLVKFQNAYNLSSKMIQTLSEMYDRLILETGV